MQVSFIFKNYILIKHCDCHGVDSRGAELLLEHGCTCDGIEDILRDTSLLREALRDVMHICGEEVYETFCGALQIDPDNAMMKIYFETVKKMI